MGRPRLGRIRGRRTVFGLIAFLSLTSYAQAPTPEAPRPISAIFHEMCGKLLGAAVTFSDGNVEIFDRSEIEADPALAAEIEALPHISVHLQSPEICGCFS